MCWLELRKTKRECFDDNFADIEILHIQSADSLVYFTYL